MAGRAAAGADFVRGRGGTGLTVVRAWAAAGRRPDASGEAAIDRESSYETVTSDYPAHLRPRGGPMPVSADLGKYLDASYADASLTEILAAPVSALAGVTEQDAEALRTAFRIRTVSDLGKNKYFLAAQAMLQLTR